MLLSSLIAIYLAIVFILSIVIYLVLTSRISSGEYADRCISKDGAFGVAIFVSIVIGMVFVILASRHISQHEVLESSPSHIEDTSRDTSVMNIELISAVIYAITFAIIIILFTSSLWQ